ncbi:MAG: methyltransferase domain-containing protein [Gemmatimonadales bacterium]|nr:MAG: methyltransferase domain-containing protein [Gemmatimonadales bacterium]
MATNDAPVLPPVRLRLPARSTEPEILDGEGVSPSDLERSLQAMAAVNRCLGGVRSILGPLVSTAESLDRPITLLDVGTGNGALPRALAEALSRRGLTLEWIGMDLSHQVLQMARQAGEQCPVADEPNGHQPALAGEDDRLLQGDGLALPFADSSVDVIVSSLTLHHLSDTEAAGFLRELSRVAGLRVLVSDLERHPVHYAGARMLGTTLWRRDPITRIDGPLSVLRSYTRAELANLAGAGEFERVEVRRHFPFRLLLDGVPA